MRKSTAMSRNSTPLAACWTIQSATAAASADSSADSTNSTSGPAGCCACSVTGRKPVLVDLSASPAVAMIELAHRTTCGVER